METQHDDDGMILITFVAIALISGMVGLAFGWLLRGWLQG